MINKLHISKKEIFKPLIVHRSILKISNFYSIHIIILTDSELPSIGQKRTEKCVTLNKNNFGSGQLPNNIWYANAYQK